MRQVHLETECGFGKDKKAMLVSDISKIHNKPTFKINQLIDQNLNHFQLGLDLIDLKVAIPGKYSEKIQQLGISQNQFNASKHIWLASERGYLKLLKIMDDGKAWDIYNDIVDNYFNMRVAIKENNPAIVNQERTFHY